MLSVIDQFSCQSRRMKIFSIHSLLLFLLQSSITSGQNGNFTQHTYIIPTEPASASSSVCPGNSNGTRCLTLNELTDSAPGKHGMFQRQEEVIFLSGMHVVNGTEGKVLFSDETSNLVLRGESKNVTIVCLEGSNFAFANAQNEYIRVSDLTLINCSMNCPQTIIYKQHNYYCNITFLFIGLEGSMIFENIQIKASDSQIIGIAVYVKGDVATYSPTSVLLTNVKLSCGVLIAPYYLFLAHQTTIEIKNSIFNDSYIEILAGEGFLSAFDVMIKNISFRNYNAWSSLIFRGTDRPFRIAIESLDVSDSKSPYTMYANRTILTFTGNNYFHRNHGVMYLVHSTLHFFQTSVEFINNTVNKGHGAPLTADGSKLVFKESQIVFKTNHGLICGGIIGTEGSVLLFEDNTTIQFERNDENKGGALSLNKQSKIRFHISISNLTARINFVSNEAQTGGAIFVKDEDYISTIDRRLRTSVFDRQITESDVKLKFSNNLAQIGGNQIYGGWIDWFVWKDGIAMYNPNISSILVFEDDADVSSDPTRVCMCINKVPNCNITEHQRDIYGQAFSLDLVAVGQRSGTVISFVQARLKVKTDTRGKIAGKINKRQKVQIVQRDCTTLRYAMISGYSEEMLMIRPVKRENFPNFDDDQLQEHPNNALLFQQFSVKLTIKNCPIGFFLHETDRYCECQPSLSKNHLKCDMNEYRILRSERQWVGKTTIHTTAGEYPGVIAHQHCPFDYCRRDSESLSIRLEEQDKQCAFNRTGTLCGGCKDGLSRILGSSRCKRCTDHQIIAIVPSFLIIGLLLVIFLMVLNLTVSVGTINGLIFYANIIQAQHIFQDIPNISSSFLSKFIAWLNLDQGIESCFYNGLDTYINTWLQFLFPLYIWLIAAALIITSHYSTRVSKLIGRNAVQVLATLFLISYAKVLRLIIDVFSFTTITYPDGHKKTVWLIDGNVEFFQGRHIPLVLVTVIFILLSLPYTFILLTIQLLYKISHYRVMFWVQRLKPFFDAYTGPYRANHRYWTGLLLVARIALLVTFSVNQHNNLSINLLAIITVSVLLLGWLSSAHWVYESPLNNFLEIFFLCNVIVTSAAVSFNLYNQRN